jgi:hypothetical protein
VNRKKGSDATVDINESKNGDSVKIFIIQVAALSWAATQVPEITAATQSFLNAGFRSAAQVEFVVIIGDEGLHPLQPAEDAASFHTTRWTIVMKAAQNQAQGGQSALAELCRLYWYPLYIFARRREHSSDDAQDLTQAGKTSTFEALKVFLDPNNGIAPPSYDEVANRLQVTTGGVKTLIHRLRKRYTALLREEVGRTVSDPAEIDEEIHALCDALVASEGRLGP